MSWTSYCKKCGKDFPVTDRCPECGAKLTGAAMRTAWCAPITPVRDWMNWNAVMRLALPAFATGCFLILLLELASGGPGALRRMLDGGLLPVAGLALFALTVITLLILALRGRELLDCVLDGKGAHVSVYLPDPSPLRLLLHFRSPRLMSAVDTSGRVPVLLLNTRDLSWKDVARVQLWPEKDLILLYAPAWWLRLPIQATPFVWDDALSFVREKLGRKKTVALPGILVAPPKPKKTKATAVPAVPANVPPFEDAVSALCDNTDEPAGTRAEEGIPVSDQAAPPDEGFREDPASGQLTFAELTETEEKD